MDNIALYRICLVVTCWSMGYTRLLNAILTLLFKNVQKVNTVVLVEANTTGLVLCKKCIPGIAQFFLPAQSQSENFIIECLPILNPIHYFIYLLNTLTNSSVHSEWLVYYLNWLTKFCYLLRGHSVALLSVHLRGRNWHPFINPSMSSLTLQIQMWKM